MGHIDHVRLRVNGVDEARLIDALSLRLDPAHVAPFGAAIPASPQPSLSVYVEVVSQAEQRYRIVVIVSDGRGYERTVAADPFSPARTLAADVATLLRGIEDGTEPPDREDAAIPESAPTEAAEDGDEEPTAVEPTPDQEVPSTSSGEGTPSTPDDKVGQSPDPAPAPKTPTAKPATLPAIGIRFAGIFLTGVAPTHDLARSIAGAGALSLDFRAAGGAIVHADARLATTTTADLRLLRIRTAVGGGYGLRKKAFELPVVAGVLIEPWTITRNGRRAQLEDDGQLPGRLPPLFGGFLSLAPGYFVARPTAALRIGARIELAGSASASSRPGVVRISVRDEAADLERLFRFGGLEASLGLELAVWIPIRKR